MQNEINGAQGIPVANVTEPPGAPAAASTAPPNSTPTTTTPPVVAGSEPDPKPVAATATATSIVEPPLPDSTVRVEYSIRIFGGAEVVADIRSRFDLPLALEADCLARTDLAFAELLDTIVVSPVTTQFRGFLQTCYDRYAKARAKPETAVKPPPDPLASLGLTLPPLANSDSFDLPEESATKFPVPKMPEFPMRMTAKNGR